MHDQLTIPRFSVYNFRYKFLKAITQTYELFIYCCFKQHLQSTSYKKLLKRDGEYLNRFQDADKIDDHDFQINVSFFNSTGSRTCMGRKMITTSVETEDQTINFMI